MKYLCVSVLICVLFSGCANYESTRPYKDRWSRSDTIRQLTVLGLDYIDYSQTINSLNDKNWYETNPLLSRHPSSDGLNRYVLISTAIEIPAMYLLHKEERVIWQWLRILSECVIISYNNRLHKKHTNK